MVFWGDACGACTEYARATFGTIKRMVLYQSTTLDSVGTEISPPSRTGLSAHLVKTGGLGKKMPTELGGNQDALLQAGW